MMPLVFVVDGVPERRSVVQHGLEQAGYRVEVFATTRALDVAEQQRPSLMLVALELPDGSGLALRDKIRRHPGLASTAVILLANNKIDKYRALGISGLKSNSGGEAQVCLSFPFAPGEIVNAVDGAMRRSSEAITRASDDGVDMVIDPAAMKIFVRGREIATTTLEFRLLDYMARHQGKVFTRDALLDAVWGELQFVTPRSVDACIRRIRRKIEPESSPRFLRTIRGIGYKLDVRPTWEAAEESCQCAICAAARLRAKVASSGDIVRGPGSMHRAASFR